MRTVVVVPPASLPVTIAEAKRHAGIDPDLVVEGLDAFVEHLIRAATGKLEAMVDRALVSQTLETTYRGSIGDRWYGPEDGGGACDGSWRLPRADVLSIVSVGYTDRSGVAQVVDPSLYRADLGSPGRLLRPAGVAWPVGDSLSVRYVAGYGDPDAVPDVAKLIVNMLVATWYGWREANSGVQVYDVPNSVRFLADALRWGGYP